MFVDQGLPEHGDLGLVAEHPVLLAEVLSSSSLARDFVEKAQEYAAIPSLLYYCVAAQDEPRLWLWARGADSAWSGPREMVGSEEAVKLPGIGVEIAMAELYAGIGRRA